MPNKEESWEKRFDSLFKCDCLLCKENGHHFTTSEQYMKEFISQTLSTTKQDIAKELKEICNKSKTERGLSRALANFISKLKE